MLSRLGPYTRWGDFLGNFVREWATWKARCGYSRVARIGVRYINRLDVPLIGDGVVHDDEYLSIGPVVPQVLGNLLASHCKHVLTLLISAVTITIDTGTVGSPLPDCISFLLDIDISTINPDTIPRRMTKYLSS